VRERWQSDLAMELTARLRGLARERGLTLNTIVQGLWAVLLGHLTGRDDVVFGVTVSGRPAELAGVEQMVGLFINTLPLRVRLHPGEPLGALLAGMPAATSKPGGFADTEWPYDKITRLEEAYGMPNVGVEAVSGGLRGNIMRTPGQRQQCFALEVFLNESSAAAGADPIEYRIAHTSDQRLIDILKATAKAAGWEARKSPRIGARKSGSDTVTGRGVCVIVRSNAYWAGIAEVSLTPATGSLQVTKFTIGCEPGKIINPRQLERCMKSGVVMGLSEALKEEVTFDKSKVTSTNWSRYRILTMAEMPEIQVVTTSRDDQGFGGGSEAANAVVPAAVAAALFDATGVWARKIPLTAGYVEELLRV